MKHCIFAIFAFFVFINLSSAQDQLAEPLAGLKPFIGKTWKTNVEASGKSVTDTARWERALNGNAVRVLHSVNNGEYGGETLIFYDKTRNAVVYYYFTTAGFFTNGIMQVEQGKFTSHELVTGDAEGVTEVKATGEVTADGQMTMKSQYLKKGEWVAGRDATYKEDPSAQVIFK